MKRIVDVTFTVEVEIDESKFTTEFIQMFKRYFYDIETIEEHIEYIAELAARELLYDFTEGYGKLSDMGIKTELCTIGTEIQEVQHAEP